MEGKMWSWLQLSLYVCCLYVQKRKQLISDIRQRRERNGGDTFRPLRDFISLRLESETDEAPERAKRISTIPFPSLSDVCSWNCCDWKPKNFTACEHFDWCEPIGHWCWNSLSTSSEEICSTSSRSRVLAHRPCPKLEMFCPSVLQLSYGCSKVLMTNHGVNLRIGWRSELSYPSPRPCKSGLAI